MAARQRIKMGESRRQVALSLGMAESTLRYRLRQQKCATKLGCDATFSGEIEKRFCNHLKTLNKMFCGITAKQLMRAAYEFAEKHKIPHRFNQELKTAGRNWFRAFIKRHPEIDLRQSTSTSIARGMVFNSPQVKLLVTRTLPEMYKEKIFFAQNRLMYESSESQA